MEGISIRLLQNVDLDRAATLLSTLNPETPFDIVASRLASILKDHPHYQLFGAFTGDTLAGVAGAWIATKIWCGKYLEIDNLVVDPQQRGKGIGSILLRHCEAIARQQGCTIIVLDSYTSNHPSHRLYHRMGFEIWGFHFVKPCGDWSGGGQS